MAYAPIMLTVFNRATHTKEVLKALSENELASESEIYIYSDGPRKPQDEEKIKEVREVIQATKGFRKVSIIEAEKNKGLANSVIQGVTDVVNKHGKVIVLEDDLITSKYFLRIMNQMLDYYVSNPKVGCVTAYTLSERQMHRPEDYREDVFFNVRPASTGWGTWKDRWDKVDWQVFDFKKFLTNKQKQKDFNKGGKDLTNMLIAQMNGKINSWAIRWTYHLYKHDLVSVQTVQSYIDNMGYDSSGTHGKNESYFYQQKSMATKETLTLIPYDGIPTWKVIREYAKPFTLSFPYIKRKLYSKLGILIK